MSKGTWTREVELPFNDFKEEYFKMKRQGISDRAIAEKWFIGTSTIDRLKRKHKITAPNRLYKYGIEDEHLETAKKNGISKRTVYERVAALDCPINRAITEPINITGWKWREHEGK